MRAYLVTGNPGSGKSALARELARRGLAAIDPDFDPELSYWEDDAGRRVSRTEGPVAPDAQWLRAHHWVWNRSRLHELLSQHRGHVLFEAQMLDLGAVVLDGTASTDAIADRPLGLISLDGE